MKSSFLWIRWWLDLSFLWLAVRLKHHPTEWLSFALAPWCTSEKTTERRKISVFMTELLIKWETPPLTGAMDYSALIDRGLPTDQWQDWTIQHDCAMAVMWPTCLQDWRCWFLLICRKCNIIFVNPSLFKILYYFFSFTWIVVRGYGMIYWLFAWNTWDFQNLFL